jgi:hypothetical protein
MRKVIWGSMAGLCVSVGSAFAQTPAGPAQPLASVAEPLSDAPCVSPVCHEECVPRVWGGSEYLLWWVKSQPLSPPLITTGPAAAGIFAAGAPGVPGTVPITGNLNYGAISGVRVFAGGWLDRDASIGLEGSGFLLEQTAAGYGASGPTPGLTLASPITIPGSPVGTTRPAGVPGFTAGAGIGVATTDRLWGAEVNALANLVRNERWTINALAGFRYADLDESLSNQSTATSLVPGPVPVIGPAPAGTLLVASDLWRARNQFYGGQFGARAEWRTSRFFVNATGKLALGDTHEHLSVGGSTVGIFPGGGTVISPMGIHNGPLNAGQYSHDQFSVIPELQANVGYFVTSNVRVYVGYNFVYWTDVLRPGDQVSISAVPTVPMARSDFFAHGLNFGLQFQF